MKVVYSLPDRENPFWRQIASGIERRAKEGGASVEVIDAVHDDKRQAEQLQTVLKQKPDAVLVSPVQTKTIAAVCKAIRDQGVPIVAVDQNMAGDVTASVISGNLRGGAMAGLYIAEHLGRGKSVVHLLAETGLENVALRRKSFINEINRNGLKVVKEIQADSSRRKAHEGMSAFLQEGTAFDAVFGENDAMALGAVDALAEGTPVSWPIIVGFDGVPEAIQAIRAGKIGATIAQNPEAMGEKSMETVFKIIRLQQYDALFSVLPKLVTKEDME